MPAADGPFRFASAKPLDAAELDAGARSAPRPSRLAEPLRIGHRRTAAALEALGIGSLGDLLEHLPFRHEDRREARLVASLTPGEEATVIADVGRMARRRTRGRISVVEATVFDESGPMKAVWFNQPWVVDKLPSGTRVVLHGRADARRRNSFVVSTYEVAPGVTAADVRAEGLTPVYPATEGVTSDRLRELVKRARDLERESVEALPSRLRAREGLPERAAALDAVHFPEDEADTELARRRLAFEELLVLELEYVSRKRAREESLVAAELQASDSLVGPWRATLPFRLTRDQERAITAIDADLATGRPMQRLLMGEVGSGKTVVALHAMLRAAENDRQAALMAPTETLAEQHMATLDRLLGGHLPIALLTSSTPAGRRRDILARLESGELSGEEIAQGRQVFVVCPLVEESETLQARAATVEAERLARTEFREQRVELIHGQMPSRRKAEAMRAFASGEAQVLVATSVIEVGIDVPNATVMLVEAAERYGISQPHQLRGRVGRGGQPGVCILFGDPGQPRLRALAEESDGFVLAEKDLAIRGAGEVLGTRQHGERELRVARLPEDAELLERAHRLANDILAEDPHLDAPESALLDAARAARFGARAERIAA